MKVAVFSDVHGNLPALQKGLAWMDRLGVDTKICLGDIFGYFPFGLRCFEILMGKKIHCLLGNHDSIALGRTHLSADDEKIVQSKRDTATLTPEARKQLESHCSVAFHEWQNCKAWFFHGTPWDPQNGRLYQDGAVPTTIELNCNFIFMGHTHRPFIRYVNGVHWVNVGSCGAPRDNGCWPSFAVLDTVQETVELFRFQLDLHLLQSEMQGKVHQDVLDCLRRNEPIDGTKLKD